MNTLPPPEIVTPAEWLAARKALLRREKELTRLHDQICAERRALPWVRVAKSYAFEGPGGRVTLGELFRGRSQLLVQHFMFGPGWGEGCPSCSLMADHVDGARRHFEHADLSYAAVSRAPWAEIAPFKKRMGWTFDWVSSHGGDFNFDFHVSFTPEEVDAGRAIYNYRENDIPVEELPGISLFARGDGGEIFHTYSTYARGVEAMIGAFNFLDLAPKGRNEVTAIMDWVRHHDRYGAPETACACELNH